MMPAIDPRYDARRKRARVAMFIAAGTTIASSALDGTRFVGWRWALWALGLTLIIVFTAISMNSGGGPRGRRGISGLSIKACRDWRLYTRHRPRGGRGRDGYLVCLYRRGSRSAVCRFRVGAGQPGD